MANTKNRGTYFSVGEMTEEEKCELKSTMYYGCDEYDWLSDKEKELVDNTEYFEDLPDSILISAFGSYAFSEEDFMCNLKGD